MIITTTGENIIISAEKIDTNNAKQFEDELLSGICGNDITIDAAKLEYISSAGLRVLLKIRKSVKGSVNVINASKDVYDIFDVTGLLQNTPGK